MACATPSFPFHRKPLRQFREYNRKFEHFHNKKYNTDIVINDNTETKAAELSKMHSHDHDTTNTKMDDIEIVWKDLETVVYDNKWERIVRERFESTNPSLRFGFYSSGGKMRSERVSHFLKVAMETAVRRGHTRDVISLFRVSAKYETTAVDGCSKLKVNMAALMATAVDDGNVDVLIVLIKNGGDPNEIHRERSLLSRAVAQESFQMVQTLMHEGADLSLTTPTGKTILHEAAATSSSEIINCLLDIGACTEVRDKIQGNTPLHIACSYNNRGAIFAMYNRGVEFNAANIFGETPLAKLLLPLTKATNSHNKARMELAKELVKIGFSLAPKYRKIDTCSTRFVTQRACLSSNPNNGPSPLLSTPSSSLSPSSLFRKSSGAATISIQSSNQTPYPSMHPTPPKTDSDKRRVSMRTLEHYPNTSRTDRSEFMRKFKQSKNNVPSASSTSESQSSSSSYSSSPSSYVASTSSSSSHQEIQPASSSDDDSNQIETVSLRPHPRTKDDRLRHVYQKLLSSTGCELSLQQRCRLAVLHSLGTKSLSSSLNKLGLPALVVRYLRQGGHKVQS